MSMLVRPRVLTAASAVTFLVASGALGFPGPAGAAVRSVSYLPKQAVAVGTGGAVASDDVEATSAGLEVLRGGGNAIDAAVAVAATLGVADPFVAGIGGGGYLVYYDARTHRVSTIDGRETAPRLATTDLFIDPATGKPLVAAAMRSTPRWRWPRRSVWPIRSSRVSAVAATRSEERRVGKEGRSRWSPDH